MTWSAWGLGRGRSGLSLAPARMWRPYGRTWLSSTALPQTTVRGPQTYLLCLVEPMAQLEESGPGLWLHEDWDVMCPTGL